MGRAQVVQAEACRIDPEVAMNPILLKPSGPNLVQVILRGEVYGNMSAQEYYEKKSFFLQEVLDDYRALARRFQVIVLEGAGSPVEMNLMDRDIVNLPLARIIDAPCLLVADIERGGVFASIVGTHQLCDASDRSRIRSFIINKFRGQQELFTPGVSFLEEKTGWPCMGVLPYLDWLKLEEEDSVSLDSKPLTPPTSTAFTVAVIQLPHLSNYTDFDPLEQSKLSLVYVTDPKQLGSPDLTILPGTKNTIEDLLWLKASGLEGRIRALAAEGSTILGICGGFQMLGTAIRDPYQVESGRQATRGLGLLQLETPLDQKKTTHQVRALHAASVTPVSGYEIHMGQTQASQSYPPFFQILQRGNETQEKPEGVDHGNIAGTYLHGIFENLDFTRQFLDSIAKRQGKRLTFQTEFSKEQLHERWATALEERLNLDLLSQIVGHPLERRSGPGSIRDYDHVS